MENCREEPSHPLQSGKTISLLGSFQQGVTQVSYLRGENPELT